MSEIATAGNEEQAALAETSAGQAPRFGAATKVVVASLLMSYFFWFKPPISIGVDSSEERCLPDFHVGLVVRFTPDEFKHGDLVYWPPTGPLGYVKRDYITKAVGAVPGDRLRISGGVVLVNEQPLVQGTPLAGLYHRTQKDFDVDMVIPAGKLFVYGTNAYSDDSRYWGLLDAKQVEGKVYKIY